VKKKLLFITLSRINSIEEHSIYSDLLTCFLKNDYNITIISSVERKFKIKTRIREIDNVTYLDVKTLNIQKSNFFEKGIGTLLIKFQYINAIKKYLSTKSFDLVLYTTPPITFYSVIRLVKKKYKSFSYLLLKDIFPQNAVDLGFINKKSLLYHYFRAQEVKLYKISDFIGCMSKGNVDYILKHNKYLNRNKIEVNPNSIFFQCGSVEKKSQLHKNLKFIYGGNLGKPQGILYLINAIKACSDIRNIEFIIAGNGTEDYLVKEWIKNDNPKNVTYFEMLPQIDYENLLKDADIGLICLDKRFTIPNYPSRLLSYMKYGIPVICLTDINSDIGKDARENGYGFWCESDDYSTFKSYVLKLLNNPETVLQMGINANKYLYENFEVSNSFNIIHKHLLYNK